MGTFKIYFICFSVICCGGCSVELVDQQPANRLHFYKSPAHPEIYNKTTPEMAARDGYPVETHHITTPDGYILGIHRIPHSKEPPPSTRSKPAVIVHHGIATSSAMWFINAPGKRLPYLLADSGYDVWLANARGNVYSRNHTYLNPDENKLFWNFSSQEIGLFDLSTLIDYVLNTTGQSKVSYIGHSMGTTAYLMLTSALPSYNDKIQVAILLAPIAFSAHMDSPPVNFIAPAVREPGLSTDLVMDFLSRGTGQFWDSEYWFQKLVYVTCRHTIFAYTICSFPLFVACGFDYGQFDPSIIDDILGHYPQGTSIKIFIHYGQHVNSGRFSYFDYGAEKNREIYNSDDAPDFELENITAPLYLIAGPNDVLATPEDLQTLRSRLTGVNETFIYVDYPEFNHFDFMFAKDVNMHVFYPVIKILNDYNGL